MRKYKIILWSGEVHIVEAKNLSHLIYICDRRFQQDYEIQDLTVFSQCAILGE